MNPPRPPAVDRTRFHRGLELLLRSHEYAQHLDRTPWDFAVELGDLRAVGLSFNDLRWLIANGSVTHASEVGPAPGECRGFRHPEGWRLRENTCFVLTPAGVLLALEELHGSASPPNAREVAAATSEPPTEILNPCWDAVRRILLFQQRVVKHFKTPAPNQELILTVFEEECWPYRIDDPLPSTSIIEPKRRLHDTINALNRNQRVVALRFTGDGQGQGICWQPIS